MSTKLLRTGEVASQAGVSVATLRYYERRGLIPRPERTGSGYRAYPPETVDVVRMIKGAQDLQFSLKEIGELLALRDVPEATCADVQTRAGAKLEELDSRIAQLAAIRSRLANLLAACSRRRDVEAKHCPIYPDLARGPEPA
jgi:DNA-binding transcriptional MerR regulator